MKPYLISRRCPVDKDMCKAIPACSAGAITYVVDASEPLGGKILFNHDQCDGCGKCAEACCGHAIEMK